MQYRFDTPVPVTAVLEIPAGHIRLIATDRTDTTVEISPTDPAKSRDTQAADQTTVTCTDTTLHIQAPQPRSRALGHPGSVGVTVHLPAGSHIQATAAATELHGTGRLGAVAYDSAQGPVGLDEAAEARVTLADGGITIGRLTGPAHLTTARGDITVEEAATGALELRTQSGDITVTAASGTSAALDASTSYGRIDNALKNDGAPALNIRATTAQGDITARSL